MIGRQQWTNLLDEVLIDVFNIIAKLVNVAEHGVDIAPAKNRAKDAASSRHIFDLISANVREFFQVHRVQLVHRLTLGLAEVEFGEPPLQHRTGDGVRGRAKGGLTVGPGEREQGEKNGGDLASHGRFLLEDRQSYEPKGEEIVQSANIWHDVPLSCPTVTVPPPHGRWLCVFLGQGLGLAGHWRGGVLRFCCFRRLIV